MPEIAVVCDTSVVLKWFHEEGEEGVADARRLLALGRDGHLTAWVLDLTFYELGNALLRGLDWPAAPVGRLLDALRVIAPVAAVGAAELRVAAELGETHELTFYDAAYAAAARSRGAALATHDEHLLDCGEGKLPSAILAQLAE
ncbi:MAG TPA: PIN domain-containing protein [Gaiellaceae bacterium]|jgi:predicted nucleic acid-binding protein|nr:PIN domain-containing protein [Gaiellaceae bacterium]